ncbi:MAG: glycosyltransferase family 2 protein [Candidatus Daviesbacteria bacterium]
MKLSIIVSVVIPNWNGLEHLKDCLPSIKTQTQKSLEVIIIDNGSTDKSVDYIKQYFPDFRIIELKKNLGFAAAVNLGVKKSLGKYIVLLNNDTKLDKNCLKNLLLAAKQHPEVGLVTAKILNFYQKNIIDNAGDSVDIVGHSFTRGFGEKDGTKFNQPGYLFLVTGGGSLIKKEVFKKIGYFDEDYFLYMEDVDFCFRAQLAGFKAWYQPKAIIYHKRMATASKNMSLVEPICFRNMTMNIIKDYPKALLLHRANLIKIILVNLNTIKYLSSKGYFWKAIRAEWYIFTHFFDLLKQRKNIQSLKIVKDQYIINNVLDRKLKIPFTKIRV